MTTQDMIDVDEAGFKIENTNPSFGKTVSWLHCYLEGEYNWEKKVNCMMAISTDLHYDMEWHDIWPQEEGGTDLFWVYVFFRGLLLSWQSTILVLDHFASLWTI